MRSYYYKALTLILSSFRQGGLENKSLVLQTCLGESNSLYHSEASSHLLLHHVESLKSISEQSEVQPTATRHLWILHPLPLEDQE